MPIQILPANSDWPNRFALIKATLPPQAVLRHIGSTAVPPLVAKDVIDIQITLPSLRDLDPSLLTEAGVTRRRPTTDHCPPA